MKISEVQVAVKKLLEADEGVRLSRAAVVAADDAETAAEVERALAETALAVVVLAPAWRPTSTGARKPVGDLTVVVRVAEKPALNREEAGFTAGCDLAEHVAAALNLATPVGPGSPLVIGSAGISASLGPDKATVAWDVSFQLLHQLVDS